MGRIGTIITLLIALGSFRTARGDEPTVTIGLIVCLSGPCELNGVNALHGATLAQEEINARGGLVGRKVQFQVEDSQDALTGAKALTAYRALRRNPNIHLFIGPNWTPGLLALAPVVSRDKDVIMITMEGGIREFHEAGDNLFNARGVDEATTRALARRAFDSGARRAAIIGSQQAWELDQDRFFKDEFERAGGSVAIEVEPTPDLTDFNSEAAKIVASKADVALIGAYTQLDLVLRSLAAHGFVGDKYIAFIDDSRIRLSGNAIEGSITQSTLRLSERLSSRLHQRFPDTEPLWTAHTAYDSLMLYADAASQVGSLDIGRLKVALTETVGRGESGPFTMNGGRIAQRPSDLFQTVSNGKLIDLRP